MYDKKFVEVCRALHLIQAKKIQNYLNLWLIKGKLLQVGQHHKNANLGPNSLPAVVAQPDKRLQTGPFCIGEV